MNGKERNSGELVGLWQLNMKHEQGGGKRVKGNFKISSMGNWNKKVVHRTML